MPCTLIIHQPQAIPDTLRLDCAQLVVGDKPDAHLWAPGKHTFTLWLEPDQQPLLDADSPVSVNGVPQRRVRLNAGDRLKFGGHELRFDGINDQGALTFYWRTGTDTGTPGAPTRPHKTLGRLLLLALIAALFIVPWSLIQFGAPDTTPFSPEQGKQAPPPAHPLEHWLATGPLHPAHQQAQCGDCHTQAGGPVENHSCFACHDMQRHFSKEKTGVHPQCITCHLEHNEPANLIEGDSRLCSQCHNDMAVVAQVLTPGSQHALTAFARFEGQHPAFSRAPAPPFNFNHQQHLDPGLDADAAPLTCLSCHQWADGNPAPVRFDNSCSQCHNTRDPRDQIDWPHGNLAAMQVFATQQGLSPARVQAVVNANTCRSCHTATLADGNLDSLTDQSPWRYQPAAFKARFSHKRHEGRLQCADCHAAATSTQSSDSLLPVKENCSQCHNQQAPAPLDQCATCHQFHRVVWPATEPR
ncbi:cytochrome c3 family protein [Simiduia agarivorans]|uniref:FHA domain-containing protein n=1 Tax=Simiduia agarivorans (strain DSM 21679 / JCM 13881 / BCRC 17597 / SA1) TaxID=1117647 RepID=K4KRI2_SIMAS|nr:cytochrome c3 family protein [Simiduia agarivorans]AFV00749.1 FHA domain-containing protein [Simiduia agarivorans SA1 = DSM 21679]